MVGYFREDDTDRLARRISKVSRGELADAKIKKLIGGDAKILVDASPTTRRLVAPLLKPVDVVAKDKKLSQEARAGLEILIGPGGPDWVPIAYVELLQRVSKAVARVAFLSGQGQGTGTMVSPRLLLTNHHVLDSRARSAEFKAQFNYQDDVEGDHLQPVDFRFAPDIFFWTSPVDELDVTLIAIAATGREPELATFGWCPLSSADDQHVLGDFVTVVQHPDGDRKQVALRENRVIGRGNKGLTLHYGADTLGGSSGSPVFNDQLDLIALHHGFGPKNETTLDNGDPVPEESNEGILISAIVKALREVHDAMEEPTRLLLAEALNPPATPAMLDAASRTLDVAAPGLEARAVSPAAVSGTYQGTAAVDLGVGSLRFPIVLNLGVAAASADASRALTGLESMNRPDPNYGNRKGYDADFLGMPIALPTVTNAKSVKLADLLVKPRSGSPHVLNYHHFSVVMRADRKLPLFTAVNVDGASSKDINRSTGEVQLEAAEVWFNDPRIAPDDQLTQDYYGDQQPRIFDRGHLVRRLDPAWGTPQEALDGALDTFHFTNCCPQISKFNQHLWLSIEEYALDNARSDNVRISVFSGPIFTTRDPLYRRVRVPKRFFKIVVRSVAGQLRSTAFIADQEPQLDAALSKAGTESFDDLGKVAIYQRPLKEVQTRAGLTLDALDGTDTYDLRGLEGVDSLSAPADATW